MKNISIILGLLLIVILQTTVAPFFSIYGAVPNLVLVLVLLIASKGFEKNWGWILLISLLLDSFSGHLFGLVSLSLVVAAYSIDLINAKVFSVAKFWIISFLVIIGTILYNLLLIILSKIFQTGLVFNYQYLLIEIPYNLVILVIFSYGFKKIFHKK